MTERKDTHTQQQCNFAYDYADKCDCREDDNCGCSFPNNIPHNFDVKCSNSTCSDKSNNENCSININKEKVEIQTPNIHIKKDSVCICSPEECECSITRDEHAK